MTFIVELVGTILEMLVYAWWRTNDDKEQRSCFWFIVILIALLILIGIVCWFVFGGK